MERSAIRRQQNSDRVERLLDERKQIDVEAYAQAPWADRQ